MFDTRDSKVSEPLNRPNILKKVTDEDIFQHFMGVYPKVGSLVLSPLRQDKHPTFSFYHRGSKIKFKDFATGETGDSFDLVRLMYGVGFQRACEIVNDEMKLGLGLGKIAKANVEPQKRRIIKEASRHLIQVETVNFTNHDLLYWTQFGIDADILHKNNVYSCQRVFMNGNLLAVYKKSDPIYCYHFPETDNVKIYKPLNPQFKWFGNVTQDDIYGEQLFKEGGTLYLTSSGKDAMTLQGIGCMAIAPQGEGNHLSKKIIQMVNKSRKTYILYDNDKAGQICAENAYKEATKQASLLDRVHILTLPETEKAAKDPSDFVSVFGKESLQTFITRSWK